MKYIYFFLFFLSNNLFCFSDTLTISKFIILNNDTIFISEIPQLDIIDFKNVNDRKKFNKLKRRVIKVYPFALKTKIKIDNINDELSLIGKKRKKKRYTKRVAKLIKEEYTIALKKLTIKEGGILIKLIYRETGISTYDILKEYRGWFNAFLWQSFAKAYGHDLRTLYDPLNIKEDNYIELIIKKEFKN